LTAYGVGANSFIRKPVSFDAFINTVKVLKEYWFEIVALPRQADKGAVMQKRYVRVLLIEDDPDDAF
jgi:hypothetical protein